MDDAKVTRSPRAEYRLINKKGEGTFSEVLKAQSTKTNKQVAIKCMKAHFYNIDQVSFIGSRPFLIGSLPQKRTAVNFEACDYRTPVRD